MSSQRQIESLVSEIEEALDPGSFVNYRQSWDYVRKLEDVKEKIDHLSVKRFAKQCVSLYETFLSGCYEKAEEIDDSSGNLGMFFEELFCSWIKARQKAGYAAQETAQRPEFNLVSMKPPTSTGKLKNKAIPFMLSK